MTTAWGNELNVTQDESKVSETKKNHVVYTTPTGVSLTNNQNESIFQFISNL